MKTTFLIICSAILCVLWSSDALAGEGCVADDLEEVDTAVSEAPERALQIQITGYGLSLACELPTALKDALKALEEAPPDMRPLQVAKAFADNPFLWSGICEEPIDMFVEMARVAPADKRALVNEGCDFSKIGDMKDVGDDVTIENIILSLALYRWLDEQDVRDARKYARWMVGLELPDPAEAPDLPLFIEPEPLKPVEREP